MILRVRPDAPMPRIQGGQYTVIGLGNWEERVPETQTEQLTEAERHKFVKRAYSISCPVLDDDDHLVTVDECDFFEFYIVLIREAADKPPALTPRLFCLEPGGRLFVGTKITGRYTLEPVHERQDVVFLATGTGEAPHNAMLAELLCRNHTGRIVNAVCVRNRADLGYLELHQQLERTYSNYSYMTLTTREPQNLDRAHPEYVGKQYIQQLITSGQLEERLGHPLVPEDTHVFLCGNPAMIGIPKHDPQGNTIYPQPRGVIEILEERGFQSDEPRRPGNIHFEKYW